MSLPHLIASLRRPSRALRRRSGAAGRRPRLEALEGRQLLTTWSYDFGTASSPVAAGYTRVSEQTRYTAALGYGLGTGAVGSRDRLVGDAAKRDFVLLESSYLSFHRDLPSGTYDVTLTMGDATYAHSGQSVWLEGTSVDVIATAKGQFVERTYRVSVTDGRLSLELRGANGNRVVYINAMTVQTVDATPPPPDPVEYRFDFGPAGSLVATNYTLVTEAARFDSTRGYGWTTNGMQSRDRGAGTYLTRDFVFSSPGPLGFAVNVPDGYYDVAMTIDDTTADRSEEFWIEGQRVGSVFAPKTKRTQPIYRVHVDDGRLDIEARGANGSTVALLNGLVITPRDDGTSLVDEHFEDANLTSRGWYDGSTYVLGNGTDGTRALQYSFHTGDWTAYDSDIARHLFAGTETVYLSFDLKLSDNWEWSYRNGGHLFYFLTNADPPVKGPAATHLTLYVEPSDGRLRFGAQDILNANMPHGMTQGTTTANNGRGFPSQSGVFEPGQWHHVEAMFTLNSLDIANDRPNADGVLRGWVDGQLLLDRTDLIFRTTDFPDMQINQLLIGPYLHYGSTKDQRFWLDNLTIANAPPNTTASLTAATAPTMAESLSTIPSEPAETSLATESVPVGPHADAMAGVSRLGYGLGSWPGSGGGSTAQPRRRPSARQLPRLADRA